MNYREFLERKVCTAESFGFDVEPDEIHPRLMPHQRAAVQWAVAGGRRALFLAFGLGKTLCQLEAVRITREKAGGLALIVLPLGVRQEFVRDAEMIDVPVRFIRSADEIGDASTIYLTNYETIREGKLDPSIFTVASLDEASCLRGFGSTKTFREFMRVLAGQDGPRGPRTGGVRYRFVATATPSPNSYEELLAYSAYLDIMDVSDAKTRFFRRNSEKADDLTLHTHKEAEFWIWCASWGLFLSRPSDIGLSDEGYEIPPVDIRWHEIPTDHSDAGSERSGQGRLFRDAALGIVDASREKRDSLEARIAKMLELRAEDPDAHRIIWHDLEAERRAIEAAVPSVVSVYGSQPLDSREAAIIGFSDGKIAELAGKPQMLGSGCNFQRHCAWAIYLGIGFKFNDFIQSFHRFVRFLQTREVRIDIIYTEAEREVRRVLERKWRQHEEMCERMREIIREHGLARESLSRVLTRAMEYDRIEVRGERYRMIQGDAAEELASIDSDSVGLVLTSIPFSNQYSYSPSYRDLGHTDSDAHFFEHLGYVTRELYRVLKPGRDAVIHVKDRIVPGGINGLSCQTVNPFSDKAREHFESHGFAFMGRKTIVTDVVRENNQTYRLGWTEQCKDATKMGYGLPEYALIFRKPQTDRSRGYSDDPVVKQKPLVECEDGTHVPFGDGLRSDSRERRPIVPGTGYSRSRWQIDAHGFMRSDGDRRITPEELAELPHDAMFRLFRDYYSDRVYDYEHHVELGEELERRGQLPVTFMLLQPPSWHPDVWTDVARMRTLNTTQAVKGKSQHLCPLPFDVVERFIVQLSSPGDVVLDPFSGLGTVPERAIKHGRIGVGVELSPTYFSDAATYCEAAEREASMPSLFGMLESEKESAA